MTNSKVPSSKDHRTSKNTVGVQVVRGVIRLSLPREISRAAYGIAQKFIATGLKADPLNLDIAEGKAREITRDIVTGNFDPSWEKYKLGIVAANHLKLIDGGKTKPDMPLLELYDLYCESRRGDVAETTLKLQFQGDFRRCIKSAIGAVGEDGLKIRKHLIDNYCTKTAKDCLRHLEKAYQLGVKHKHVNNSQNPFEGMAAGIKLISREKQNQDNSSDSGESDTRAFSVDEMNAIIEAFETNSRRRHFAPIIKFLFWTGCRTGEAVGLKWRDINWDRQVIQFRRTYSYELKIFTPTKTGTIRIFPLPENGQLWNLLKSIPQGSPDDIVFKSKEGKVISSDNLGSLWRGGRDYGKRPGLIPELIAQGKVKEYLKLYATRHTFISHQVNIYKVPITTVSAWVGNGAMIANNSYLDRDRVTVPGYPETTEKPVVDDKLTDLVDRLKDLSPKQLEALRQAISK